MVSGRECSRFRSFYNQNLVLRSTLVFFGDVGVVDVDGGEGETTGVDGNCGRPAAAIIVFMKCCCIINIIIEVAMGLKRAELELAKMLVKSGMEFGVAILL